MSPLNSFGSPSDERPASSSAVGSSDLFWDAFRYVSGDDVLPDGSIGPAAARFEERLATDQAAREAVAQVVSLVAAIKTAAPIATVSVAPTVTPSVVQPVQRTPRRLLAKLAPLAWMSVGAAAMWLLGVGLPLTSSVAPEDASTVVRREVDYPAGLAAAVSTMPAPHQADDETPELPTSDAFSELAMLDAYAAEEGADESLTGVPAWMLQAVSESQRQTAPRE